ncbi:ABC transporter permease [Planosporangium sp. 12N6]|uniref:ABC transporter permease n=1 Tax=Planosporangium spinosum TaxID=3402278 RepID=UPI003CF36DB7
MGHVSTSTIDSPPIPKAATSPPTVRERLAALGQGNLIACLTVGMIIVSGIFVDGMFTVDNFATLARLSAPLGILALASAIVIMTKNVDLSVVAVVGIAGMATVHLWSRYGFSELTAVLTVVLIAAVIGLLNGWLVAYVEIPALFVTLGTWKLFEGVFNVTLLKNQNYILPRDSSLLAWIGHGYVPIAVAALVFVGGWAFIKHTSHGQLLRAIGDSPAAARLTGVPVRPLVVSAFVIAALLAALVGLLVLGINGGYSKAYGSGQELMFNAITAAVIGGVSLTGGKGTIFGVLAGTAFISVFVNLMTLLNASVVTSVVVQGLILLAALAFDAWLNPRDEETAKSDDL